MQDSEKVIRRLYEITNSYDLGFETQIEKILKMGLERFHLDIGILAQVEGDEYVVKHCVAPDELHIVPGAVFDFNTTYCQITCQTDGPTAIENIGKDDRFASHPAYQAFPLESYIGMPLRLYGQLYGTLNFSSPLPYQRRFSEVDLDAIQLMSSWVEIEIIRRQQEERLQELNQILERKAYEDSLTGVPNRRSMFKHISADLNRITREHAKVSVAIIDIDRFKNINDSYGHQKGDQVLYEIAQSLNNDKRDYDFLARYGGEEFLLWLPNTDRELADLVCTRMKDKIESLTICEIPVTISIGVSCYISGDLKALQNRERINQLISEADKALYDAKQSGRNAIRFFQRMDCIETEEIEINTSHNG